MSVAIVSLASGGRGYLQGAVALGVSLQQHAAELPRVLLIEKGVYSPPQQKQAGRAGWDVQVVDRVRSPKCKFAAKRWPKTFTKLRVWELVDFEKVIYLDADCFAVGPFTDRLLSAKFETLAAARVNRGQGSQRFNSGVMVLRPEAELANELITTIRTRPPKETRAVNSDQGFLNVRFRSWTQIPDKYNVRDWRRPPDDVRIAHLRPHPWEKGRRPPRQRPYIQAWQRALASA